MPNCSIFATVALCRHPESLLACAPCDGREDVIGLRRLVAVSALLAGVVCGAAAAANAGPSISAKRAEAQRVLGELQQLDASAQRASSRYQLATQKLHAVEEQLAINKQAIGVAKDNLTRAQHALAQRLVAIYTSQDQSSLSVILGATSIDDLVTRLEAVNTVTNQDSSLIKQVVSFQRQVVHRRVTLRRARIAQTRLVAVRAAAKRSVDNRLASEQRLYDSVRSEIGQLEAQQRAAELAAAQRARQAAQAQTTITQLSGGFGVGEIPGDHYSQVVSIATQYLGVPYRWGGADPSGFDCSGLVMYVYAQVGVSLPHNTVAQWDYPYAVSVPRNQLEPGDLVFFAGLGHVGIYIGNNQFIHAPHTGSVVSIESLTGWYAAEYDGAKRILH
jgi:peptidoglycan DL-endopeptidase CwlO